jgi:hypothetical protein
VTAPPSNGPGKYNDIATMARELANAEGVVLVVINGIRGEGFEVQGTAPLIAAMPRLLRMLADDIERGGTE